MGVDPEDVYDTRTALRTSDPEGAPTVPAGPRMGDHCSRRLNGCVPGAVGEELMDADGADTVAVVRSNFPAAARTPPSAVMAVVMPDEAGSPSSGRSFVRGRFHRRAR